jgi:hypothetical protein
VVGGVVVSTNGRKGVRLFDGKKVFSHTVHESAFGLADILYAAAFAADTIDQIITFASNIKFGTVFPACGVTVNCARFV